MTLKINTTINVSPSASVGEGTTIWHLAHVREDAVIGENCNIGSRVKIQIYVSVYEGLTIENGVMEWPR